MHWWLFLIPFFAAIIGWLMAALLMKMLFHPLQPKTILGMKWQGFFPKNQQVLANNIAEYVSTQIFTLKEIEEKLTNPEGFKKIIPQIDQHIDNFLRVKLPKDMPMIGMFIGDRTINQLKNIFVEELELLFPEVMANYVNKLESDGSFKTIIENRLAALPVNKVESLFVNSLKPQVTRVKLLVAVIGFLIGLLQVLLTLALE